MDCLPLGIAVCRQMTWGSHFTSGSSICQKAVSSARMRSISSSQIRRNSGYWSCERPKCVKDWKQLLVWCAYTHIYIYILIYIYINILYTSTSKIYIYIYICPQSIYLYINDSIRIYIYFLPVYLSIFVEELWRTGHFKPGHHGCSGSALQNEPHPRIFFSWATIIFLKAACISR